MLCAKHGFAQSMDWAAQSIHPRVAWAIHGLRYVCTIRDCASCMCVGSLFMLRGMCQLTTKDRSIMVDQAAFDDFIAHNFV